MSKTDFPFEQEINPNLLNDAISFNSETNNFPTIVPKLVGDLELVINRLLAKSHDLKKLAKIFLTKTSFTVPEFLDSYIIENQLMTGNLTPSNLTHLHIGAVDGGLVTGNLAGIDILGLKTVGIYLHYGKSKISKVQYIPKKHQDLKIVPVYENFSNLDFDIYSSLKRSILELQTALKLIDESQVTLDYLLIDGSFQLKRHITTNLTLNMLSGQYFAFLRKLIFKAKSKNISVIFVVKDSKTSKFTNLISQLIPHIIASFPDLYQLDYRKMVQNLRDSNLMHYLLEPRSRSFVMNQTFNNESIELDYIPYSFYLKVVKNDLPLRIDILTKSNCTKNEVIKHVNEICGIVLALSEFNSYYSLPAPIIEADARARINLDEFNTILNYIRSKTFNYNSIEGMQLRRSRSPFKF
jgi:hypothetical protein